MGGDSSIQFLLLPAKGVYWLRELFFIAYSFIKASAKDSKAESLKSHAIMLCFTN
jgi:hypothetical protein